jgi:hypothetical protein
MSARRHGRRQTPPTIPPSWFTVSAGGRGDPPNARCARGDIYAPYASLTAVIIAAWLPPAEALPRRPRNPRSIRAEDRI